MNRPGFALIFYNSDERRPVVIRMSNVDNKKAHDKCHGQKLAEIAHELRSYFVEQPQAVLVREEALAKIATSAKTVQI